MGKAAQSNGVAPSTRHNVQVGDVFVESWGYDQTNVDCYVVVEVTNTMVGIKPCGVVPDSGERLTPDPTNVLEFRPYGDDRRTRIGIVTRKGTVRKRVTDGWKGDPWISLTSYSGASRWDGERTYYETPINAGH